MSPTRDVVGGITRTLTDRKLTTGVLVHKRPSVSVDHSRGQVPTLAGCYVERIPNADAKQLILRYEWLGSMPRRAYSYGLKSGRWGATGCDRVRLHDVA